MNRLFSFVLIIVFAFGFVSNANAQNPDHKVGLSFKKLFLDYQSQNGGQIGALKNYQSGYEIGLNYNLHNSLNLVIPFHVGVPQSHVESNFFNKTIYGVGAHLQYQFYKPQSKFVPYIIAGLNGVGE